MVNLLEVFYLWLYSVRALYGKFIVYIQKRDCMVNLLEVFYLWLYSVRALYGKFIGTVYWWLYSVKAL